MILHRLVIPSRIRRLAAGEALDRATLDTLFTHVRGCAACKRDYDLAMGTERLLASQGTSASLPAAAMLVAMAARVVPAPATEKRPMPWLVPALASACAAMLVLVLYMQRDKPEDFGVRSGNSTAFTVRVFCDTPPAAPVPLEKVGRCTDGAMYRFAYTAQAACEVEISAIDKDNVRRRVWPSDGPPRAVTATSTLRPLGATLSADATAVRFDVSCKTADALHVVSIPLAP